MHRRCSSATRYFPIRDRRFLARKVGIWESRDGSWVASREQMELCQVWSGTELEVVVHLGLHFVDCNCSWKMAGVGMN